MKSIYERALGSEYQRLHPKIQKKFALTSERAIACRAEGIMSEIWGGRVVMRPFFQYGVTKKVTFSERGHHIPFTLENYPYINDYGQECIAWLRKFHFQKIRHFDATMVYSEKQQGIVDYLGADQDMMTNIGITVLPNGGIRFISDRLFIYKRSRKFAIPSLFSAKAIANEWFNEQENHFHIKVEVKNRYFGTVLGYKGTFTLQYFTFDGAFSKEDKPRMNQRLDLL